MPYPLTASPALAYRLQLACAGCHRILGKWERSPRAVAAAWGKHALEEGSVPASPGVAAPGKAEREENRGPAKALRAFSRSAPGPLADEAVAEVQRNAVAGAPGLCGMCVEEVEEGRSCRDEARTWLVGS